MTRTSLASRFVTLAAALALTVGAAGCNSSGLTATGHATVTSGTGANQTTTGFAFSHQMRLDGGAGTTTGTCSISRGAPGQYGVVIDLYGNSQATGLAVRSITIMAHTASAQSGSITADLGGTEYTSASGACQVNVTTVDEGAGGVALTAQCPLANGAMTASSDISLELAGCTVM